MEKHNVVITKSKMINYIIIQYSGMCNMLSRDAEILTGLTSHEMSEIMAHYREYRNKFHLPLNSEVVENILNDLGERSANANKLITPTKEELAWLICQSSHAVNNALTVGELVEKLQKCNKDAVVMYDTEWYNNIPLCVEDILSEENDDTRVTFSVL